MMTTSFRFLLCGLTVALLGTSGCSKEARKTRSLERANRSFQAEQFAVAEIEYLNALRLAPDDHASIRQLGLIYHAQGRTPHALKFLRKAHELDPENIEVQQKLAMTYLAVKKTKEARELALKVLTKRPDDEDALLVLAESAATPKEIQETQNQITKLKGNKDAASYHLASGTLFFRKGEIENAEREFKMAAAMDSKSGAALLALGNIHWLQSKMEQAESEFRAAAQTAPPRSPRRLKYADFLLSTGRIDEAKKLLEEITQKTPDYIPAWSTLIQITFAQQKHDECSALISKVLSQDPENYDALFYSASLKRLKGETAKAIEELERMQKFFGETPKVHYELAVAHVGNGDVVKATRLLERAITVDTNFTQAILSLSELQIRQGGAATAIPRLVNLIKSQPKLPQAQLLLGSAHMAQKNLSEAEAVYRKMTETFPKEPQAFLLLGMVLAQQNKHTAAQKAFENALVIVPGYLPALDQLVTLELMNKNYSAALERVQDHIQKNPKAAEPWLLMARIELAQKKKEAAETSLQKSISLNPDLRIAYMMLAQLYVESNRHPEALAKLNKVIEKTNDVSVLMQTGMIHDELKNFAAARDVYEKLLSVNPRFSPALNNLAYIYSEHLGQLDKAYDLAQKARQLLPYDPFTADTLGWILYKRGDYSRAVTLLQESASKLVMLPEIEFHLGMAYYMLGEERLARSALENALQSTNTFPGKEDIQPRLAVLSIDEKAQGADAIEMLEKRVKEEPRDATALGRLADIYLRTGSIDKAVATCETALKSNPSNARFSLKLAQIYSNQLKNSQKAYEYAKQAHSASPNDPAITHLLGRLAYDTGDFKRALSLLQEASSKLPKNAALLHDLAWSYYSLGQITQAEATMQAALDSDDGALDKEDANMFLAMVKAGKNPTVATESVAKLQAILKAKPDYSPALMAFALAQEQQGNISAAKELYEKVLARFPFFTAATRQLAFLYANRLNDHTKAFDLALKVRTSSPQDYEITRLLGVLAFRKGDFARSAQYLKESNRVQEPDADSLYYLGMAQYRLKDLTASKASLQRALNLNLAGNSATEAKKILAELK